jgi:hypothetical protein
MFTKPVAWSASMVSTWPRFIVFSVLLIGLFAFALVAAATPQWHGAAWGLGFFLGAYQLAFLYALRRLVLALERSPVHAALA